MKWRITAASLTVALVVLPAWAHAQSWDYLFSDLTWPDSSNPVSGSEGLTFGSVVSSSVSSGTLSKGSDWGQFLFSDLTWPDASDPFSGDLNISLGSVAPLDTGGNQENDYWNYLFQDLPL